jgi:hypothetical protein
MHQKHTEHGRFYMQNNQFLTRSHFELDYNSITSDSKVLLIHQDRGGSHSPSKVLFYAGKRNKVAEPNTNTKPLTT